MVYIRTNLFAIQPANASKRSVLSRSVPNCFWNNTVSKRGVIFQTLFTVSFKENSASAKRGRTTFRYLK